MGGTIGDELIGEVAGRLIRQAAVVLPDDVRRALAEACDREESMLARQQLGAMLQNARVAEEKGVPLCQDTGVPVFFLSLGSEVRIDGDPARVLEEAVRRATEDVPLRQNVIHPLTRRNSGTNTGWGVPIVHWDFLPGADYLEMMFVPKGFGAEMRAAQCWVLTSEDAGRAAAKAVLDVVQDSMGEPCPPVIIGVGIGGTADQSAHIAKRALFRSPLGTRHSEPQVAALEEEMLQAVNETGLGPMGLGGKTYALAVHVEICGAHTAVVPVSVFMQCWAARYAAARIYGDGRVLFLAHAR
ncbi:MAG: fumarate hydratase [Bacillota bacterium]